MVFINIFSPEFVFISILMPRTLIIFNNSLFENGISFESVFFIRRKIIFAKNNGTGIRNKNARKRVTPTSSGMTILIFTKWAFLLLGSLDSINKVRYA